METVCRLKLEMNYDLIDSTHEYQSIKVKNILNQLLTKFLYLGKDGLWYSKDKHDHERIYGTVLSLTANSWFRKYVKVCEVHKEDNEIEDIVEQL